MALSSANIRLKLFGHYLLDNQVIPSLLSKNGWVINSTRPKESPVERLAQIIDREPVRIGLSATQAPYAIAVIISK